VEVDGRRVDRIRVNLSLGRPNRLLKRDEMMGRDIRKPLVYLSFRFSASRITSNNIR
jgi:hypothetical protein